MSAFLDAVQARLSRATPGPWTADPLAGNLDALIGRVAEVAMWRDDDADLIAHAPADLAALLSFAREVAAANDRYMRGQVSGVALSIDINAALNRLEES